MNTFSEQQLNASAQCIESLRRCDCHWIILLAQMQSGKTETFLLVACELIRCKLQEYAVVFSGNSETDLRDQLKKQIEGRRSSFVRKYKVFLRNSGIEDEFEREDLIEDILSKIKIVWGSELDSYDGPTANTLFIWEEAHYAQSKTQRPDKFLKKIGISADGNAEVLQRNKNLMMTISATPFSELSDNLRLNQGKRIVKMEPATGYVSVKSIRDSRRIRTFEKYEDGIVEALHLPNEDGKKYGIIRMTQQNEETVKRLITEHGWHWMVYDSLSKGEEKKQGDKMWGNMANAPAENTVILIRGKCRMGKNLEKKHVSFVFESAKDSNTDTVLQSLLGRVCGYSEGSDRVIVYLSEKIVRSGEINRYVEMWEDSGVGILPTRAANMTGRKVRLYEPIIPIRVEIDRNLFPTNDRSTLLRCLRESFDSRSVENRNSEQTFEVVRRKVITNLSQHINGHYADGRKDHQLSRMREVISAYENRVARDFGSAGGIDSEGKEIKFWIPKSNAPAEFDKEFMYVTAHVPNNDVMTYRIPATTGGEAFAPPSLEEDEEEEVAFPVAFPIAEVVSEPIPIAFAEVVDCRVEVSTQQSVYIEESVIRTEICRRVIASFESPQGSKFENLYVTPEIYKNLKKSGSIYNYVFEVYDILGQKIKLQTKKGRTPKSYEQKGLMKIDCISW